MEDGSMMLGGKMAALPYTRVKGDTPIADLGVTLSAHRALGKAECQLHWFSMIAFFRILMSFLLEDLARPFPCG